VPEDEELAATPALPAPAIELQGPPNSQPPSLAEITLLKAIADARGPKRSARSAGVQPGSLATAAKPTKHAEKV